ncbi:MAG: hypothetical protein KKB59_10420 [Spirochaetes bacterium]|nr:hypothetical protein [Spirochaetota bacterium]
MSDRTQTAVSEILGYLPIDYSPEQEQHVARIIEDMLVLIEHDRIKAAQS